MNRGIRKKPGFLAGSAAGGGDYNLCPLELSVWAVWGTKLATNIKTTSFLNVKMLLPGV
jgi:hypothetical protein